MERFYFMIYVIIMTIITDNDNDFVIFTNSCELIDGLQLLPADTGCRYYLRIFTIEIGEQIIFIVYIILLDKTSINYSNNNNEIENEQIYRRSDNNITNYDDKSLTLKINPQRYFNPNIICNQCDRFIYDLRFHCQMCLNFDLCRQCFKFNSHPHGLTPLYNQKSIDSIIVEQTKKVCCFLF